MSKRNASLIVVALLALQLTFLLAFLDLPYRSSQIVTQKPCIRAGIIVVSRDTSECILEIKSYGYPFTSRNIYTEMRYDATGNLIPTNEVNTEYILGSTIYGAKQIDYGNYFDARALWSINRLFVICLELVGIAFYILYHKHSSKK